MLEERKEDERSRRELILSEADIRRNVLLKVRSSRSVKITPPPDKKTKTGVTAQPESQCQARAEQQGKRAGRHREEY